MSLCYFQGGGELSLSAFRCLATSLPFTFPSIGHVTRVWPEPAERDRRDSQNAFFFLQSARFRYLMRFGFITASGQELLVYSVAVCFIALLVVVPKHENLPVSHSHKETEVFHLIYL